MDHGESEYEVKTRTGSSFLRHCGKKADFRGFSTANISVAMGVTRGIFGAILYVWSKIFGENFKVIAQGHHRFVR